MAYEPNVWQDGSDGGTPITAAALNHIEGGIADAVNGLDNKADKEHVHSASDINSGVLPAHRGGTGEGSLQDARNAMGLGDTLDALPVANGGTGATDVAGVKKLLGLDQPFMKKASGTKTYSLANSSLATVTIAAPAIEGYSVIGCAGYNTGDQWNHVVTYAVDGSRGTLTVSRYSPHNDKANNVTAEIRFIYVKNN